MPRFFVSFFLYFSSLFALPTLGILDPNANIILSLQNQCSLPILENLSNNLTHPNEVINTLFHETSNKQKHHKAEQGGKDTYALTRGKTAENIFALKNYANTNTNTLTNTEWNTKYQNSKVFKQGNQLNKETWQRNAEGSGERDNFLLPALRTAAQAGKEAIKKIARNGAKESAKESGKQASKNAQKEIKILNKGSTAKRQPSTQDKINFIQKVKDSPLDGAKEIPIKMNDPRWSSSQGWVKMQRTQKNPDGSKTSIHFNYNKKTGVFDDFKLQH